MSPVGDLPKIGARNGEQWPHKGAYGESRFEPLDVRICRIAGSEIYKGIGSRAMRAKGVVVRRRIVLIAGALSVCLGPRGSFCPAASRQLSEHVRLIDGPVNGVVVERGGRRLVVYGASTGTIDGVERVLFTHSRRDIVWAGRKLAEGGAESIVPLGEVDKFNKVDDFWSAFVDKRFHDYNQQGTKILTEPLSVSRAVRGGDTIQWKGMSIQVLDTPGYTRGSVSYFLDIDGIRTSGFCARIFRRLVIKSPILPAYP